MLHDARTLFPNFYTNPAILALASASRWTVSGPLGSPNEGRKAPIDIRHLLRGCSASCQHQGPFRGAYSISDLCLVTLDQLTDELPGVANCALHLQSESDGYFVLDIEKSCPPDIAADLLRIPGAVYTELSMSGRGFHLMFPVPSNRNDFPLAVDRSVLKEEHGWYELLFHHWCTFTRNPVPEEIWQHTRELQRPAPYASIDALYAELAAQVKTSGSTAIAGFDLSDDPTAEIPESDEIIDFAILICADELKTPQDFNQDLSRYEFSVLAQLYKALRTTFAARDTPSAHRTPAVTSWLLFHAATHVLPPRPKHQQMRGGKPFLLNRAAALVAQREADRQAAINRHRVF